MKTMVLAIYGDNQKFLLAYGHRGWIIVPFNVDVRTISPFSAQL